jgi:ATP-binding cassette subfamily C protein
MDLLVTVAIAVTAITLFSSVLRLIQAHLVAHFAQRLELGLALDFGRQILQLPLSY